MSVARQGAVQLPSLRTRLLRHVMLPLALTWLAGTLVALQVAQFFTARAFDRALLDDAYMVASNVRLEGGQLKLVLTPREIDAVLFDQDESVHFSVEDAAGQWIAGGARLPATQLHDAELPYEYHDIVLQGTSLRAVTLERQEPAPFRVVMAQTTRSRSTLLTRVLLYSIVPQILLLVGLALWLARAIGQDTRPLSELQHTVDARGQRDLAPIELDARTADVQRLRLAINSLLARLDVSLKAQREFTGNVAHELRTPLAGIRALAEYGLAQKDPQAWRTQLERIAGSEQRASRMVDQLLALALADEARTSLALKPVALDTLVIDAALRFLPRADARRVDLGAVDADMPCWVEAEPTLVEGILNNLLDNALRYGRPEAAGATPTLTITLAQDEHRTVLSVADNGPGMAPGMAERMTQRWAQGEAGATLGHGVGLGLAIVAQYAHLLGARLELTDAPQGGLLASVVFAGGRADTQAAPTPAALPDQA